MTTAVNARVSDAWLLPILRELLPEQALQSLESKADASYWQTAVDEALLTDDDILSAISARARVGIASDLLVSSEARDKVSERLARRFAILPLSVSESALEIATSNPYDLDCEKTLAFAASRAVRMSLASPARIQERIEEVYAPVERLNRMIGRTEASRIQPVVERADAT
ncbi:MAG: hypothetical protein M3037_09525, partial [Gemmatimonadota bacterium]|nr:hypothetical protein [Gemmatimonadota bacterium]